MALLNTFLVAVTVITIFCSSSVLAGDAGALQDTLDAGLDSPSLLQQARPEVSCELRVREKYRFYDIDGSDVGEWRTQMKQNGTKWNDGKVYAALTSWDIRYFYDLSHDDGRCSIKTVKTEVDIVYLLPRRTSSVSGPELTLLWDEYLARLKEHEFGHKDLAVKTAAELNETLASLASFGSEDELELEANRRADEKLRSLKEIQVAYDDETRHGETQGAVLPAL